MHCIHSLTGDNVVIIILCTVELTQIKCSLKVIRGHLVMVLINSLDTISYCFVSYLYLDLHLRDISIFMFLHLRYRS